MAEMESLEPVRLQEDDATGARFLIYGAEKGPQVEIQYEGEQLWMTQQQAAELFGVTVATISRHIANIYEEGELAPDATLTKIERVRTEGERQVVRSIEHYNLDMIISVGYRVSSKQATMFRRWATDKLVQFATKGFVIDVPRMKDPQNRDRIAELREIIRDIRSDEANVYAELKSICAMCEDYDGASDEWHEFYRVTQAKLIYAVTSCTPAELIRDRASSRVENMGLTNWVHENIRKTDVTVSKSYLGQAELAELNRLTVILLDIFEDQLKLGRLTRMQQVSELLDRQLSNLGRVVLRHGGKVKMATAKSHAEKEYEKFKRQQRALRQAEGIAEIKRIQQSMPKTKSA